MTDTAERVNTNDPHFIPLISRAQPYLVSKGNTHRNHGHESAQSPSQQQQSSQKHEKPHLFSGRTRTFSHPEEESLFNMFSHTLPEKDLHDDEEQSAGPPLHSPGEVSFVTDSRPPPLAFSPTQGQQSQTVSPGFKFTTNFKDLENFLNDENIENFFQMRNFYHKNNKKPFPFPSSSIPDKFPNFESGLNVNNLLESANTLSGDTSQTQLQLSFPELRKFGSVFNFPPISRQTVGNTQNNPAVQNNNKDYQKNFNPFHLPRGNSPFNQLNHQVPWTNSQNKNLLFPPSSFSENFNKAFKEFNTPFPPNFSINGRSTAKSGNNGGFKGQRRNQFKMKDVLPPRQNRVPLRRYQQQNNYSPRQSYPTNNYQGGIQFNPAPAPFPNYNTDKSYNSQQTAPYANEPAKSLADRGLKPLGLERPHGNYVSGPTLLRTAILDANVAGIDGVSDLYDWLGSDEPLIQKFQ